MTILLLLLFIFLPPIVSLSAITANVSNCRTQRCGNVNVSYPFFIRPPNTNDYLICGYPDYDMTCDDDVLYKELFMSVYRIIKIDMKNKTMLLAEKAAFVESDCPQLDHNFTGQFLTADVTNLTFFFDCRDDSPSLDDHRISCYSKNATSTYVFDQMKEGQLLPKDCDRVIEAPVLRSNVVNANLTQNFKAILKLGFELYWNVSIYADCSDCEKSGGLCAAYPNPQDKVETTCVCEDGRRSKPNYCRRACQLTDYTCGGDNSNSTHTRSCGSHRLKCSDSNNLEIQFGGKGPWYGTGNITYPSKKIRVLDYHLTKKLPKNCDFLYNFTSPISDFYPSSIAQLNASASIFNCSGNSYNFSNDIFEKYHRSGYCSRYDLYYSHHRPRVLATSVDNWVEWEMSYHEDGKSGDIVDFSLLSVGFSNRRILSPGSFNCQMKSGLCSPVSDSSFNCSCDHGCGGKSTKLSMALISASASVACLVFLVLGYWLFRRKRRGKTKTKSSSCQSTSLVRSILSEFSATSTVDNGCSTYSETHIFSYKELEKATDGFSADMEIGDGGFGAVYKGVLGDGRIVAVKRPYENNFKRLEQFINEIAILKQVRHPNLVSLYGCTSHDSQQLLLVYEFVPNGTVADHLALNINPPPLAAERGGGGMNWALRMNIAVEIAEALSYLHSFVPQIIHRDVKTNNILLDNDYHVKVADFGLSRLFPLDVTHVSTAPQGTPGYVDPEYYQCYQLTDKSDVFSFGVVLVELISSKPALDITRSRREINLSNFAMNRISNGLVHELADPMLGYETDPEVRRTVKQVAEVAFLCLQSDKDMRPPMKDVKEKLVDIVSKSKCATFTPTMPSPSQSPMSYSNTTISTLDFHSNGSNSISKTEIA